MEMEGDRDTLTSFPSHSDKIPLVGVKKRNNRSTCLIVSLVVFVLLAVLAGVAYVVYWKDVVGLKVMTLNTWGMPAKLGAWDKEERMAAIGRYLARGEYDVILLEELWMRPDHETIRSLLPSSYTMTNYSDLAWSKCDGSATPWDCSGLAVVTRLPIRDVQFTTYTVQGTLSKITDGEYFSGKGVGRVRLEPQPGMTVDILVTHTIASEDNHERREQQVEELVEQHIKKATADFVILGGDFNAAPQSPVEKTYEMIKAEMTNSIEELFSRIESWLNPEYATYGNRRNTYSGESSGRYTGNPPATPVIYDYIFHKKNTPKSAMIWTNWFHLPFLHTKRATDNFTISLSDHEAVTSHLYLWKQS